MHEDDAHDSPGHGDHGAHRAPLDWSTHFLFALVPVAAIAAGVWLLSAAGFADVPLAATLVLVLPLVAFAVQMLVGRFLPRRGDWVSLAAIGAGCVLSTWIFLKVLAPGPDDPAVHVASVEWFSAGNRTFRFGIAIDGLTACMLFIVTFIGGLIHLYSVGYMHGDPRYQRFFGFLSLFSFSMLGLVLSDNLVALYCFWELVGLCSYLLIGFWFEKPSAAAASMKAFLVNRVGDIGFFLGLAAIYKWTGSVTFTEIFDRLPGVLEHARYLTEPLTVFGVTLTSPMTIAGIALFCGAIGKSAQFPLHVWLPDAMEGPTPVSALIHAATMVAAGVYMVGRLYPLFTPGAFLVIAYVGLFTALFAGTIAIAQNDIKRVLAYSTVSQLGYMITAMGVGGFTAGLFHLATHAFFKALLFLCSGSVIHAVATQDMREMGGLWRKIPITFGAMLVGTLAICGFPGTSGFYSKDAILEAAYAFGQEHAFYHHRIIFWAALLAAGVTAFYSFRLIFMTFFGEPRDRARYDEAHESPPVMTAPLIVLATYALVVGWFFLGEGQEKKAQWAALETRRELASHDPGAKLALLWGRWFPGLVEKPEQPVVRFLVDRSDSGGPATRAPRAPAARQEGGPAAHGGAPAAHGGAPSAHAAHGHDPLPGILAITVVLLGTVASALCFLTRTITISRLREHAPELAGMLETAGWVFANKYFVDEIYHAVLVRPFLAANELLRQFDEIVIDGIVNLSARVLQAITDIAGRIDLYVVDGLVNAVADMTLAIGNRLRNFQAGVVQDYLIHSFWVIVLGLLGLQVLGGGW
jgi:NADH-quinone oxidoreductase subunit L